jgi:hypothetical protein
LYWAGLYDREDVEVIRGGANKLMAKAAELTRHTQGMTRGPEMLRIEAPYMIR